MAAEILLAIAKGAIIGGTIGWATNKLAVWMLFNPKRPLQVLGWRLPLTPGLVVKNQHRLANAVGQSVARDLLDPQTITSELQSIGLGRIITSEIASRRTAWLSGSATGKDLANRLGVPTDVSTSLGMALARALPATLHGQMEGASPLRFFLKEQLASLGAQPLGSFLTPDVVDRVCATGAEFLGGSIEREPLRLALRRAVSRGVDSLPGSPILDDLEAAALEYLKVQSPQMVAGFQDGLAKYLTSAEFGASVRPVIIRRLHAAIIDRFPMARMFVNESVLADLVQSRWGELSAELANVARGESAYVFLEARLQKSARELTGEWRAALKKPEGRAKLSDWVTDLISGAVPSAITDASLKSVIEPWLDSWRDRPVMDLLPAEPEWLEAKAEQLAGKALSALADPTRQEALGRWLAAMLDRLLNGPALCQIVGSPEAPHWQVVDNTLTRLIDDQAAALAPRFLREELKLDDLVTRKIEDFETRQLEETINKVSGRELTGIIRLGGLIGVAVGVISEVAMLLLR